MYLLGLAWGTPSYPHRTLFGWLYLGGRGGEYKPRKCIPLNPNPNHRHPGLNFSVAGLLKHWARAKAHRMPTPRERCRGGWGQVEKDGGLH